MEKGPGENEIRKRGMGEMGAEAKGQREKGQRETWWERVKVEWRGKFGKGERRTTFEGIGRG